MEIWAGGVPAPRGILHVARDLEARGWDGLNVVDSQNLAADPFVALAMAATVTSTLKLGTGVSNSVTRTAAVLASAVSSVQSVSRGRAVLGIGRGDSALAHLGRAPARLGQFERYLRHLQAYLAGDDVPFDELVDIPTQVAAPVSTLELAHAPESSRVQWLAAAAKRGDKVPVEVAATGPKVIAIAALNADRVMFALGADAKRIEWGMSIAREARRAAGLPIDSLDFGAYVPSACHSDAVVARNLVRGNLTVAARFAIMHGNTAGPLSEQNQTVMESLRQSYDMHKHTHGDSAQAAVLTDEFIDDYAAVGTPEQVIDKLCALKTLGLSKVVLSGSWRSAADETGPESKRLAEEEVLPALRD